MSHLMSTIHQGTISDADLISWIQTYGPEGCYEGDMPKDKLCGNIASHHHVWCALNLFESRAEHVTITGVPDATITNKNRPGQIHG